MQVSLHCRSMPVLLLPILLLLALLTGGCPTTSDDFVSISEHGFDPVDNQQDHNDYPWAMYYFSPDTAAEGHLYVGTGNSIIEQGIAHLGSEDVQESVFLPPEIRRYRPDLGEKSWEKVLDYRDVESGPEWETSGFRGMADYRAQASNVAYLYAGTIGLEPALWRSPTGDAGTWERVWNNPEEGSIRSLAVHSGLLYIAVSHDSRKPSLPAEIYATDGQNVWLVLDDGFGDPENAAIFSLASFKGWLYAGTSNPGHGYQVWKLEGPQADSTTVQIVDAGGPSHSNTATTQMLVFQNQLYVPSLIYGGLNIYGGCLFRGADMIRIDAGDNVETIVGPGSIGGIGSGFDDATNAYLWSLVEHKGKLYCGTWDSSAIVPVGIASIPLLLEKLGLTAKAQPDLYDIVTGAGAQLYASSDGVHWDTVFTDGLGNPDNYGVRNMVSVDGTLYLGLANVFDGLEIWRSR